MEMTPEPLTRPELDAKLEAMEARMDGRMDRLETRMDGLADKVETLTLSVRDLASEARENARTQRWWFAGMIATLIFSVLSTYAANWSIVQSVTAVYESGRNATPRP